MATGVSRPTTTTTDGVATTNLTTSTNPGDTYTIKAKVTTLKWNDGTFDLGENGLSTESDEMEVVPGKAHTITPTRSKAEYHSDATDTVEIQITVTDEQGNFLADETPVTWILDRSTGGFSRDDNGKEEIEFELEDGKAKATIVAPEMPFDQNLIVIVDDLTQEISMPVKRVTGDIASSAATLDVHTAGSATITLSAVQAADDTPVEWFSSSGSISPASGTISGGGATATLNASGSRIGQVAVTAKVGDRLFVWNGQFTSSAPVQISFDNPFLLGGLQGGQPPQNGNGEDFEGPWFVAATGKIRAPNFGGYPATITVLSGGSLVQVTGLNGSNQITLDQNGNAAFQVAAAGTAGQLGNFKIRVNVNPENEAEGEVVNATWWTYTADFVGGLFGQDTSGVAGLTGTVVGGYIIIGDIGSIGKNLVRHAGWTDKEPNNAELVLGAVGIVSTLSFAGDGIVGLIKGIVEQIGNSPLTDVLWRIAKKAISGTLPTAAERGLITKLAGDAPLQNATKAALSDDKLFTQAAKAFEQLGDPFANALKNAPNAATVQKVTDVVGSLSDDVLASLKNSGKPDDALEGLSKLVGKDGPATLAKMLNKAKSFSGTYKQADLLVDANKILTRSPNAKNFDAVLKRVRDANDVPKGAFFEIDPPRIWRTQGERLSTLLPKARESKTSI